MRKTSQDGGDSTSIISGVENETKKPTVAIIKNKRNSIKRKVQTLSHESDDAVSEPLLQREKEAPETIIQSAKFSILKSKTEPVHDRDSDKDKLLPDNKAKTSGLQEVSLSSSQKENISFKSQPNTTAPLYNHMNTNVFSSIETTKFITAAKNQILVEIDGCKQVGYNPSPLIFTTAKIHSDSKTKQMEPVQVTAVPIFSTTEIPKTGKASCSLGAAQTIPSTSDTKLIDKSQKKSPISSITTTAGTNTKAETTNESKIRNTPEDHAVLLSNSLIKDSTKPAAPAIDPKASKSVPNKFEDKLSEIQDLSKTGESVKKDSSVSNLKSAIFYNKDVKNVIKTPTDGSDNISGTSSKSKTADVITKLDKAIVKKDSLKRQDSKVDENANANTVTVQLPAKSNITGFKKSPVDSKNYPGIVSKDKVSKDAASLTGNKQLPRQKNVVVEDTGDIISKSHPCNTESSSFSNNSKYSKDIEGVPTKSTTQTKMSVLGASDVSIKTLPNSSANNIIDVMNTKTTATSIASKPTSSLISISKSTAADSPPYTVTTASQFPTSIPTSSKIPSVNTKSKSSILPLTTSAMSSSTSKTASSTLSSVTSTKEEIKAAATSTTKPSYTGMVTQSSGSSKFNEASSVKHASSNEPTLTTTSNGSNSTSASLKSSVVKSTNVLSIATTSTAKPVTTTPNAKSSASSRNNGPKTSEVNKDSKSFKT